MDLISGEFAAPLGASLAGTGRINQYDDKSQGLRAARQSRGERIGKVEASYQPKLEFASASIQLSEVQTGELENNGSKTLFPEFLRHCVHCSAIEK